MKQGEELNRNGEVYIHKYPEVKVRLVDGSRLAAAVVINSVPKATTNVVMIGNLTKVAYTIAYALCQRGVQVVFFSSVEFLLLVMSNRKKTMMGLHSLCY